MEGDMPNWVWKSYYKERTAIKETEAETVAFGERSWNDDGEGHMCDLWKKCRRELQTIEEDIRGSGAELGFPSWSMNTNMAVVHLVSDDGESVRTAEYIAHVWSPFAIPRALKLQHRYHCRPRSNSIEFFATWAFAIKEFDGEAMEEDEELETKGAI